MDISPPEHAPHSAFVSIAPLKAITQENDLDMVRCEAMHCTLSQQACADRWRISNATWKPGAKKKFLMCENCAQGKTLAKRIPPKPSKQTKKFKPWESLMAEKAALESADA